MQVCNASFCAQAKGEHQNIAPRLPLFTQGPCKPQPLGLPSVAGFPLERTVPPAHPSTPRVPRALPLCPGTLGLPLHHPSHLCSSPGHPALGQGPQHLSGCTRSPPACPFIPIPTLLNSTHPSPACTLAKELNPSTRHCSAGSGGTRSPQNTGKPQPVKAPAAAALVLGTLCPGWPQGGSGHLRP